MIDRLERVGDKKIGRRRFLKYFTFVATSVALPKLLDGGDSVAQVAQPKTQTQLLEPAVEVESLAQIKTRLLDNYEKLATGFKTSGQWIQRSLESIAENPDVIKALSNDPRLLGLYRALANEYASGLADVKFVSRLRADRFRKYDVSVIPSDARNPQVSPPPLASSFELFGLRGAESAEKIPDFKTIIEQFAQRVSSDFNGLPALPATLRYDFSSLPPKERNIFTGILNAFSCADLGQAIGGSSDPNSWLNYENIFTNTVGQLSPKATDRFSDREINDRLELLFSVGFLSLRASQLIASSIQNEIGGCYKKILDANQLQDRQLLSDVKGAAQICEDSIIATLQVVADGLTKVGIKV